MESKAVMRQHDIRNTVYDKSSAVCTIVICRLYLHFVRDESNMHATSTRQ
jgi:hypothetical protein